MITSFVAINHSGCHFDTGVFVNRNFDIIIKETFRQDALDKRSLLKNITLSEVVDSGTDEFLDPKNVRFDTKIMIPCGLEANIS